MTMQPRSIRPAPDPLGSYLRPGHNDHNVLAQALAERRGTGTGFVINPAKLDRQRVLVEEGNKAGVETILDSKSLELSTLTGFQRSGMQSLAWADSSPHTPASLDGAAGSDMISRLADEAARLSFSAVLAPTHYIEGPESEWFDVDAELIRHLRVALDDRGLQSTLIYYPLMTKMAHLQNDQLLDVVITHLANLEIDAVWLRLHPFGTPKSGPLVLKRYLEVCRKLHDLNIPLVAEHSGSVGVALMAFGAVGGIESGITYTDSVDIDSLTKPPKPANPFSPSTRVYLHTLGAFIEAKQAPDFFSKRGMKGLHGCHDATCCPRGWQDMIRHPAGHFLRQRASEVSRLTAVPPALRAGNYMENVLRPATDLAIKPAEVEDSLAPVLRRLNSWRGTLGADLVAHSTFSVSTPASGRKLRHTA